MSPEAHRSAAIPDPGFGPNCMIAKRDLELLLRGAESEREIGYRNLFTGIAISCGFGTLSTILPRFDELATVGVSPVESFLLILLIAATLASGALAAFFHQRLKARSSRGAFRVLDRHIRAQLDQPTEVEDPRHWP